MSRLLAILVVLLPVVVLLGAAPPKAQRFVWDYSKLTRSSILGSVNGEEYQMMGMFDFKTNTYHSWDRVSRTYSPPMLCPIAQPAEPRE